MIESITDVAAHRLCSGCGACSAVAPGQIVMVDDEDFGRVPQLSGELDDADRAAPQRALSVCPGIALDRPAPAHVDADHDELYAAWGPVYQVCEGWAADGEIRHAASSGGAATALALYCLEHLQMSGVVHTAARDDAPLLNKTVFSTQRAELLARTGSRYAPASPCEGLTYIRQAQSPAVFIGKPCDVAAISKIKQREPALRDKIGLTIAFFCAGTPTLAGTQALLRSVGIDDPTRVVSVRYRGHGWPGRWRVQFYDAAGNLCTRSLSYEQSWGFLERFRPWRCRICPDHTGEHADIAVGDAWHRAPDGHDPGRSLIIARTKRGQAILKAAVDAGYLSVAARDPQILDSSQPGLRNARRRLWGQMISMRMLGLATPRYRGFRLWQDWLGASLTEKARSIVGTVRRVKRYGLRRTASSSPETQQSTCATRVAQRTHQAVEPKVAIGVEVKEHQNAALSR